MVVLDLDNSNDESGDSSGESDDDFDGYLDETVVKMKAAVMKI